MTFSPERSKTQGANKFLGRAGHDDLNAHATILQQANDFGGFVSCDSAGNAKGNLHIVD